MENNNKTTKLRIGGTDYETIVPERYVSKEKWKPANEKHILSHIPGKVLTINVKDKQKVKKGECLFFLEAMKMKNQILAPFSGTIKKIHVEEGQTVPKKFLLLEFE